MSLWHYIIIVEEWNWHKWACNYVKEDWWSQLGNSARWKVWPRINKLEESEVYRGDHTIFLYSYMVCRWVKCIYTWVEKGQITYRVYTICRRENQVCSWISSKVNHVSGFFGRYISVQAGMWHQQAIQVVYSRFVSKGYFQNTVKVWLFVLYWKDKLVLKLSCFGRKCLSSYLVILYWLRRLFFFPHIWRIG